MITVLLGLLTNDELVGLKYRIFSELKQLMIDIKNSTDYYDKTIMTVRYEDLISIKDDINEELINRGVEI